MQNRVLCVAEKPSIAKAIAQTLGGGSVRSKKTGNKYIWNYELGYNSPVWGPCEVTVTSVSGHLTDIEFLPPFNEFQSEAVQLFSAPIRTLIPTQSKEIAQNIEKLSRKSSILYIWTDCDREGEHIGSEVADLAKKANRQIQVYRALFNNAEPSHLKQAASNPRLLNKSQVEAVNLRRELDLRSGYALTRLQTKLYRQTFRGEFLKRAVQYGSCQFPTLGFVVDRHLRIKNHVVEPFWHIEALAKGGEGFGNISLSWKRGRLFDRLSALCFYERALESGNGTFSVTGVSTKPTVRYKPLPLTTVILQKHGSRVLRMSAKKIMDVAERLYNEGLVSYPRTETDSFDKDMDLKKLVRNQTTQNTPWSSYASGLLETSGPKFREPRSGKHDDKAHPPIHPVQAASQSSFRGDADKWKVYEYITRTFLACCSDDARGYTTTVRMKYGPDEEFSVAGVQVTETNFLDVYPYQKWTGVMLPQWKVNDEIPCASFNLKEGKTGPPAPLTESELVGLMDANGIGTDATMADHIMNIQDRKFVVKRGQYLEPTPLGIALVLSYEKIELNLSLTKPFLRRETEIAVSSVANGTSAKAQVLGGLIAKYETVFKQTQARQEDLMLEAKKHILAGLAETSDGATVRGGTNSRSRNVGQPLPNEIPPLGETSA